MNSEYQIQPTSGETIGVQQSLAEWLWIRLCHVLKTNPSFALNPSICIEITGDGTVVSRSLHLVRGGFRGVSGVSGNPLWAGLYISSGLLTELFSQPLYFYTNYSYPEAAERCMNHTFISNFSSFAP